MVRAPFVSFAFLGAFETTLAQSTGGVLNTPYGPLSMLAVGASGAAFLTSSDNMPKDGSSGTLVRIGIDGAWGSMKALSAVGMVVALDLAGNPYVTAQGQGVARYSDTGATTWTTSTKFNASDMAINSLGDLFVVGSFNTAFNVSPEPGTQLLNPPGSAFVPFVVKWTQW